jgi:tripeptidyl-peptidase-2
MNTDYSLLSSPEDQNYTWTSRGPTPDGHSGVSVCAPGGAITNVPTWTLQKSQLMNGTSMSSPNCCGGIALLISGLKQSQVGYNPRTIRRALENTAVLHDSLDPLAQGAGVYQTVKAFDHLVRYSAREEPWYQVEYGNKRGLYVREPTTSTVEGAFTIRLCWPPGVDKLIKANFDQRIELRSTASWVTCPETIHMHNTERNVNFVASLKGLAAGYHRAQVLGFGTSSDRTAGPLFSFPVTIIIPEPGVRFNFQLDLEAGQKALARRFFLPPQGTEWCSVTLHYDSGDVGTTSRNYTIHALQIAEATAFSKTEFQRTFGLLPSETEKVFNFPVRPNTTLELVLGQFWSQPGRTTLSVDVRFRGLNVVSSFNFGANTLLPVELSSLLSSLAISPSASLTAHATPIRPSSSELALCPGARNRLPRNRQIYALNLNYTWKQTDACEITPRLPLIADLLYESPLESQFWLICDTNNKVAVVSSLSIVFCFPFVDFVSLVLLED